MEPPHDLIALHSQNLITRSDTTDQTVNILNTGVDQFVKYATERLAGSGSATICDIITKNNY